MRKTSKKKNHTSLRPCSVIREGRQEVAHRLKRKDTKKRKRVGHRKRVDRKKRVPEERRTRDKDRHGEEWKEKNQANWYAAHNNRRVEQRGSEVRPARGSYCWGEGGINTISFSRLLFHGRHVYESGRVDTRARTCTRASLPTVVFLLFLFSCLPPSSVVSVQQPVANPEMLARTKW